MKNSLHRYGYSSPTDGTYFINGELRDCGEDFRTVERYEEYKDAGMDTLLLQGNDPYRGEMFITSGLKKKMDDATKAGIHRIIVFDSRIQNLSNTKDGLIGLGKKFVSESGLRSYLADCIRDYSKHPSFIGIMLKDEPSASYFLSISQIEKALREICPTIEFQCNLFPYYGTVQTGMFGEGKKRYEAYAQYVDSFCAMCPQKTITMDSYPFRDSETEGKSFIPTHFPGIQILADTCKKHHRNLSLVLQSFGAINAGKLKLRVPSYGTMNYQYNTALAFGAKEVGYFTYWRKQVNSTNGEFFIDGSSFMTSDGKKTPIYGYAKKIHEEKADIEAFLLNYEYQSSLFLHCPVAEECKKEEIEGLSLDSDGPALVTELKKGDSLCYCLQNLEDPDVETKPVRIRFQSNQQLKRIDRPMLLEPNASLVLSPGEMAVIATI